jgi:hypothetical protein
MTRHCHVLSGRITRHLQLTQRRAEVKGSARGCLGSGLEVAVPPLDISTLDHFQRREHGSARRLHLCPVAQSQGVQITHSVSSQGSDHVTGHIVEAHRRDDRDARLGSRPVVAFPGQPHVRLLARRIEVVGPGLDRSPHHRLAVEVKRSGTGDHRRAALQQGVESGLIIQRNGLHFDIASQPGCHLIKFFAVTTGEHEIGSCPFEFGSDQLSGVTGRPVNDNRPLLIKTCGHAV